MRKFFQGLAVVCLFIVLCWGIGYSIRNFEPNRVEQTSVQQELDLLVSETVPTFPDEDVVDEVSGTWLFSSEELNWKDVEVTLFVEMVWATDWTYTNPSEDYTLVFTSFEKSPTGVPHTHVIACQSDVCISDTLLISGDVLNGLFLRGVRN